MELIMEDDVANQMLQRCIELLAANDLQDDELAFAHAICHEQRNNPAVAEMISSYTKLADEITDGIFSATLASWAATKQ